MTGRELYEQAVKDGLAFGEAVYNWPGWDDLTPVRQAVWDLTAAEYVSKRLDDEAPNRMTDEGGPAPREDKHGN